jgi:hypothetical protein
MHKELLGVEERAQAQQEYNILFDEKEFWAFCTSANPLVRKYFYRFLTVLTQKSPGKLFHLALNCNKSGCNIRYIRSGKREIRTNCNIFSAELLW